MPAATPSIFSPRPPHRFLPGPLLIIALLGMAAGAFVAFGGLSASAATAPATPAESALKSGDKPAIIVAAQTIEGPALGLRDDAPSEGRLRSTFGGLALMALGGVAWWASRRRQGVVEEGPALSVVSTLRLGGKHQVSLVRVAGQLLVVGATERGLELLTTMPDEVPLAPNPAPDLAMDPALDVATALHAPLSREDALALLGLHAPSLHAPSHQDAVAAQEDARAHFQHTGVGLRAPADLRATALDSERLERRRRILSQLPPSKVDRQVAVSASIPAPSHALSSQTATSVAAERDGAFLEQLMARLGEATPVTAPAAPAAPVASAAPASTTTTPMGTRRRGAPGAAFVARRYVAGRLV